MIPAFRSEAEKRVGSGSAVAGCDCCSPAAVGGVLASVAFPDPGPSQSCGQSGAQPWEDRGGSRSERSGHATAPVPSSPCHGGQGHCSPGPSPRLRPPVRGGRHCLSVQTGGPAPVSSGAQGAGPRATANVHVTRSAPSAGQRSVQAVFRFGRMSPACSSEKL